MIERNYGKLNGETHENFIKKVGRKLYRLEVYGDIITDLNDEKITPDKSLITILQKYKPGDEIELTVIRNKKEFKVKLTLGSK